MVGLFDRVGLRKNAGETVDMICRPFQVAVNQSEEAYRRRITGEGIAYWERQKGQFQCRECGEEMAVGYVAVHTMT